MVRPLPDDSRRYEIIDGALFVTPAPSEDGLLLSVGRYRSYLANFKMPAASAE